MAIFLAGLIIFFGLYVYSALLSRVPGSNMKEKVGYGPYTGLYGIISIVGLS